jgi:hypothetical protein
MGRIKEFLLECQNPTEASKNKRNENHNLQTGSSWYAAKKHPLNETLVNQQTSELRNLFGQVWRKLPLQTHL